MIHRAVAISISMALLAWPALAEQTEMVCQNPRQGYSVVFDDMVRTFLVGAPGAETPYMVESVETDADGVVVRGKTVKGGPGFVAYLGGRKRIEFIDGGEVVQTDACQ